MSRLSLNNKQFMFKTLSKITSHYRGIYIWYLQTNLKKPQRTPTYNLLLLHNISLFWSLFEGFADNSIMWWIYTYTSTSQAIVWAGCDRNRIVLKVCWVYGCAIGVDRGSQSPQIFWRFSCPQRFQSGYDHMLQWSIQHCTSGWFGMCFTRGTQGVYCLFTTAAFCLMTFATSNHLGCKITTVWMVEFVVEVSLRATCTLELEGPWPL